MSATKRKPLILVFNLFIDRANFVDKKSLRASFGLENKKISRIASYGDIKGDFLSKQLFENVLRNSKNFGGQNNARGHWFGHRCFIECVDNLKYNLTSFNPTRLPTRRKCKYVIFSKNILMFINISGPVFGSFGASKFYFILS